ncbi:adhesion G protein-coupled receptor E3-like [Anneissia japonica]|uniref:adhesion G protein-coupled receptor E3-like n=1 Tax=Anneissia japonica TaxID=1529436 RepID=UPI0014259535|nr:adhesion G protein-coupled receptor E3-like [Anneissia japonica]
MGMVVRKYICLIAIYSVIYHVCLDFATATSKILMFGDIEFYFDDTYMKFNELKTHCGSKGYVMAYIENVEQNNFIAANLMNQDPIILGIRRQNGVWIWDANRQPADFTAWKDGQIPVSGNNDYAYLEKEAHWISSDIDTEKYTCCRKMNVTTTTAAVTTTIGLHTTMEFTTAITTPALFTTATATTITTTRTTPTPSITTIAAINQKTNQMNVTTTAAAVTTTIGLHTTMDFTTAITTPALFTTATATTITTTRTTPTPGITAIAEMNQKTHQIAGTITSKTGCIHVCVEETPEVSDVNLTSDPNSVTFSTSVVVGSLKEDGPFKLVASLELLYDFTLETINGNELPSASDIVTIDIHDRNQNEISINCKIFFPVIKVVSTENNSDVNIIPACHYKHDINDKSAFWSTDGCVTVYGNDYMVSGVTCICNHMTSFVILMKPKQINNKALSVFTTVGVSISNVFLIITLVIICCFKDLRNSDRYRILRHLVTALLCANLFFLLLEVDVKNSMACSLLAGCLHYSLLVAFSWMLIMSTDVYMKIKHPFADHDRRFLYSRYIGWIGPIIVVGTTVGITRQNYASDKCWLDIGSGAIWAFVSFVCLTLLIVLVQLVVIGFITFKKSQLPNQTGQEMKNYKRIRTLLSGILLLTPAVGLSWIFGVIIVFCDWEAFKYIYVIFNSMQGFFIWLSQCAFSKEVRKALIKKFSNQISQESTAMELRNIAE